MSIPMYRLLAYIVQYKQYFKFYLFILIELKDMLFPATTFVYSRNLVKNTCNCGA